MKAVKNPSEITEEDDHELLSRIDPDIQKDSIRRIINYQKSLYVSCSSSSAASCSSFSSTSKRSNLLGLMKGGSTSLKRLFDMEHTSLYTYFNEYSTSPIIKPIDLWGSDEDEIHQRFSPWAEIKTFQPAKNVSRLTSLSGFASGSSIVQGKSGPTKKRGILLLRTKSFRRLPGFAFRRSKAFGLKLRLRKLRIMICGRKF